MILVSGTREGVHPLVIKSMFNFVDKLYEKKCLIHGACQGVDKQSANYARELGWEIKEFKPDWSLGKHAGLIRNTDMVNENPDFGIFIPGPNSRGTYDCLEKSKLLNKPYILYDFKKKTFNHYY